MEAPPKETNPEAIKRLSDLAILTNVEIDLLLEATDEAEV